MELNAVLELNNWILKQKVAYHKHDGWREHPVAVKEHNHYFTQLLGAKAQSNAGEFDFEIADYMRSWYREQSTNNDSLMAEEENMALRSYIQDEFRNVNHLLRNKENIGYKSERISQIIKALKTLGSKWQAPAGLHLYRGFSLKEFDDLQIGDVFVDRGFVLHLCLRKLLRNLALAPSEFVFGKNLMLSLG